MSPMPFLSLGSFGGAVKLLQTALNLWPNSQKPPLDVDSQFGLATDDKVREFQGTSMLSRDGMVGENTWNALQPWVDQVLKSLKQPTGVDQAGDKIVQAAEAALSMFGWNNAPVVPDPGDARIAAAICADPSDQDRPRQGGVSLLSIFQIAGAGSQYFSRCTTITREAVGKWQEQGTTEWRNSNDLCAWCGIFCYYIYRCAGIDLGGWTSHASNIASQVLVKIANPKQAFRGCIGVIDGIRPNGHNHHFIVTDNDNQSSIFSIDGNAFGPIDGDYSHGLKSVIARKKYSYSKLKSDSVYFLYPNFLDPVFTGL